MSCACIIVLICLDLFPDKIDYTTFLSVSASLVGFLITTLSILLVFPNGGRMSILKKHKSYKQLFNIFILAISFQIILFIISLIGNLYCVLNHTFKILFLWILLLSIMLLILCLWIIKKMIDTLFNET